MPYAAGTTVPVEKTMGEIVALVKRAGAERVAQMEEPEGLAIQFFARQRMIRFRVHLPGLATIPTRSGTGPFRSDVKRRELLAGVHRQRARALLLVIKAKLESVESEVETFEQAFLANVVMADGATVYERIQQPLALEYDTGRPMPMMLPPPGDS